MQGTVDSMLARQKEAIILDLGDILTKMDSKKSRVCRGMYGRRIYPTLIWNSILRL